VAAGALFFDDAGRIMLVRPSCKPALDIPGGYVERDESPLAACRREVREELGIGPRIGHLLVVDWAPHPQDGDKVLYVFDGGTLTADDLGGIRLDPHELAEYVFHPPDEAAELLVPRLARRVRHAVRARLDGVTLYLEHGEVPA
jgi:8-oxo-dGTP pyrophosphatase MutT (NUDIX family)